MTGRAVVVNRRHTDDFDIYIGRPTKWGNPFTHLFAVADSRDDVTLVGSIQEAIDRYTHHLMLQVIRGDITIKELASLHGKRLGCWCAGIHACHGDVLVDAAEAAYQRLNGQID